MYEQNGNTNKERENLKRNQKQILELKSTITQRTTSLERFKGRFGTRKVQGRINKFEDRNNRNYQV